MLFLFFFVFINPGGEKPTLFSFHDDINFCVVSQLKWSTGNLAYPFCNHLVSFLCSLQVVQLLRGHPKGLRKEPREQQQTAYLE